MKHLLTLDWRRILSPCCLAPCIPSDIAVVSSLNQFVLRADSAMGACCFACGRYLDRVLEIEFCDDECRAVIVNAPRVWLKEEITLDWASRNVFVGASDPEDHYGWIIGPTPVEYVCLVCRALRAQSNFQRLLVCWPGLFGVVCRLPRPISKLTKP